MSFSSGLPAVLKQEPQTEQPKINKSSLNISPSPGIVNIQKHNNDKQTTTGHIETSATASTAATATTTPGKQHKSSDLIDNHCACGSPQGNANNQHHHHHQQQQQQVGEQNSQQTNKGNDVNDQGE